MLVSVGPYTYRDTLLLQKACRVLRAYYICAQELSKNGDGPFSSHTAVISGNRTRRIHLNNARLRIEEALGTCLLPSLQLVPANLAVGQEIWELLNLLPCEARYRLYGEWEKDDEQHPVILAARKTAKLDTRRILKRLAKENLKQLGRMVAKLAHANPMTVLRTIVYQIDAYTDMITPVVDAFKYFTQVEFAGQVQAESLQYFEHLFSLVEADGDLPIQLLNGFPSLVPLTSDDQDVRHVVLGCCEELLKLWTCVNISRNKNGISVVELPFLGELLGLMVQPKTLIPSYSKVLSSFIKGFTHLLK